MLMLTFADDVDVHSWSASIQTGGRLEDEAFGNNGQMTKVTFFLQYLILVIMDNW